ncbi:MULTISPECIES: hypothetical protein [unclassified Pantoea]|uniref:hypothetical protein n=1 Tax=unclassified Pantoea TaxID=2630326 RepID=UPI00226A2C6D|nr:MULTISPECIES: hypothetical protein [unclassified Pantoea]
MQAMEVQRDEYGYWTHPEYDAFCDGRESISSDEMDKWMTEKGLEWGVEYRDEDDIDPDDDGADISPWEPSGLKGEGWFVGSIHDSEDGAVCIWLRHKQVD